MRLMRISLTVALGAATLTGAVATVAEPPSPARAESSIGGPITRSEVLARAQNLVDRGITYGTLRCCPVNGERRIVDTDQATDAAGKQYRADCSGLVSMAWHLPGSPSSAQFLDGAGPSHRLGSVDELRPGDAVVKSGHIELFAFWDDDADHSAGAYVYSFNNYGETVRNPYAVTGPYRDDNPNHEPYTDPLPGTFHATGHLGFNSWSDMNTYEPIRYANIVEDAPSWVSGSMMQDFSGDGKIDLIWRYDANKDLKLLRGNGDSGWLDGGNSSTIGGFGIADIVMAVPDFDGDGSVDILWRHATTGDLMLLRGDGAGGYLDGGTSQLIGGFGVADRIFSGGDFDGDANIDIIWRHATTGDLMLLRSDGAGGWLDDGNSTAIGGFGIADIVFSPGDFDGDANIDIIWRHATTGDLMLLRSDGTGGWLDDGNSTAIGGFGIADMIIGGDLSADGNTDIVWRDAGTKELKLLRGDGAGGWLDGGRSNTIGGLGIADMIL